MPRRWVECGILVLLLVARARAQSVTSINTVPPGLTITNQGAITATYTLAGFTPPITVIFQRDDGATDTQVVPANGTQTITLVLSDLGAQDGRQTTWSVIAQDSAVPANIRLVPNALTIRFDNVVPAAPLLTSPPFPATVFGDTLTTRGRVNSSVANRPETTGTVFVTRQSAPGIGTLIGAGAILSDASFTATADLRGFTTGVATNVGFQAEDGAGNRGALTIVSVTKLVAPPPTLSGLTSQPPDNSLTNNPAVLVRGTVTGQVPPFTVNFFVDGFLESQVAGLVVNEQFAHTLTLASDGPHTITVQATNANVPPNRSLAVRVATITLDTRPPGPPTIVQPIPTAPTLITLGPTFVISGVSVERAFCTTNPTCPRPRILLAGPAGIRFNPASPLTPNDLSLQFTTTADITGLADGQFIVDVISVDAAGNTSAGASAQVIFVKDTTPAQVVLLKVNGFLAPQINPEVFVGLQQVTIEFTLNEDMPVAPRLTAAQAGGAPASVPLSTSAGRVFTYTFFPARNRDGVVDLTLKGGADRAGNPMDPTFTRVFVVDTTPPVLSSITPSDATTVGRFPSPLRVVLQDPLSAANTASGVDLLRTTITIEGPSGPRSAPVTGTVLPFDPRTLDFFPTGAGNGDGTYRVTILAVDNVGNAANAIIRTFILDTTPIALVPGIHVCNPPDGGFVNPQTFPGTFATPFVEATVNDPQFSTALSEIELDDFCRTPPRVPGTKVVVPPRTIRSVLSSPLATNGTQDGRYAIGITIRDSVGNTTPQTFCTFVYDSIPPATDRTFPAAGVCINGPLRHVDATLFDPIPDACRARSGIDRTRTQLRLFLQAPNTAFNRSAARQITGVLRFISVGNVDRVLLEIVDRNNVPVGLALGGADDGLYRIEVVPVDRAGNAGPLTTAAFNYDSIAPELNVNNLRDNVTISGPTFTLTGDTRDNTGGCDIDRITGSLFSISSTGQVSSTTPIFQDVLGRLLPVVPPPQGSPPRRQWTFTGDITQVRQPTRGRLVLSSFDRGGNVRDHPFNVFVEPGPLLAPTLSSPPTGSATNSGLVVFSWRPVTGAFDYRLTIRTPKGNEVVRTSGGPTSLRVNISLFGDGDGRYQWTVQALDAAGNPGVAAPNFVFDLDTTAPAVVAVDILDPSPESRGVVNAGEVRFKVTFAETMDTSRDLSARVISTNSQAPPLTVTTISYVQNVWIGRTTIPINNGRDPDYNGLAELEVSGGVDRAGNAMLQPARGLLVFEIDTGPFLRIGFFQNPVDPADLVVAIKGFTRQGGIPERIVEAPTVTFQRIGEPDQSPQLFRNNESSFRGTFRVNLASPVPIVLAVTARDERGNTATRTFNLTVTPAGGGTGTVRATSGALTLTVTAAARSRPAAILSVPARLSAEPDGADLPPDLVRVARLDQFGPVGLTFDAPAGLAVDIGALAQVERPDLLERAQLYAFDGRRFVLVGHERRGPTIEGRLDRLMPLALLADTGPPAVTLLAPGADGRLDPARPRIEAQLTDGGSGVDPSSVEVTLDGRRLAVAYDAESGRLEATVGPMAADSRHETTVAAGDRAGNRTRVAHRLVAPPAFGLSELVPFPNPTRVRSRIRYRLNQPAASVKLRIADGAGRRVRQMDGPTGAGPQTVDWGLDTDDGHPVASGVYFVKVIARSGAQRAVETTKIAVIR